MQTPYGSWHSPISSELIASATIGLSRPLFCAGGVCWAETRPSEAGRTLIVQRLEDGRIREFSPPDTNIRSRVHEYGGGAWTLAGDRLWYVDDRDQRIYRQEIGPAATAITPPGSQRYADLQLSPDGAFLAAVREQQEPGRPEPRNSLVVLALQQGCRETTVASGADFYASARFSADGKRIAWLSWDHPSMPWDQTNLWVGDLLDSGELCNVVKVAGNAQESLFQPEWGPNGQLYVVSDRSGWWNLYRCDRAGLLPLLPMTAEFGRPQWVFGMSTYGVCGDGTLVCAYSEGGRWRIGLLNPEGGDWRPLALDYSDLADLHVRDQQVLMVAASPSRPPAVVRLDLRRIGTPAGQPGPDPAVLPADACQLLRQSMPVVPDPAYLSEPQSIDFPSAGGATAHALYYPPHNRDHRPVEGELPPLLVRSHGGPTAAASTAFSPMIQYWTSRGFAVLDVNYGGSTGYGRSYRARLDGRWGQTDVDDCVFGARFLIAQGLADPQRCAIRGSSAGGYTTLAALTFHDLFRAGASLYGISDLEALTSDTHKFESHYLDRLVGPYPQQRQTYYDRSPIHFPQRIACPVIFFQGLKDKVVPPSQAETMVQALRDNGLPVAYLRFPNERHGFRNGETIKAALEAELYFYSQVFGFEPDDQLPGVTIDNLQRG